MTTEARDSRQIELWPNVWNRAVRNPPLGFRPQHQRRSDGMAEITNANGMTRDPQRSITAATAIGMNALKPIMHVQVSMLRMWADSIERFAGNYEKGFEETATKVEEQSGKERAA
jgi:hypothetical protein